MKCLRCDSNMVYIANEKLQLGQTGWFLGDLPNLFVGAMKVKIYRCPNCKKLEFFSDDEYYEPSSELVQTTCPKCGQKHDFDMPKCPHCGYNYYGE